MKFHSGMHCKVLNRQTLKNCVRVLVQLENKNKKFMSLQIFTLNRCSDETSNHRIKHLIEKIGSYTIEFI